MKILKIVLITLLILVSIPFIAGIFIDQEYSVAREVTIDQPKEEVFEYVKLLKNQDNFSSWALKDPKMTKSFKGVDGEVGFVSGWKSEDPNVGIGEQEILAIDDGKRIDYALRFKEPFEASDKAYMAFETINETQTKVIWGFEGKMDYPMNTMLLMMDMEEMIGNDFQEGLQKLKLILENQ
ncbi:SRPBCC family protein [uncultured Cyclobacterium sp.]|uniref:SRPBCC family protein n=1 Tax=uncultured Cyclobacterium sp. TaxID=453820 RepID=UPI0030EB5250|tara:strand:- start:93529 stop:94071 length:543 start_codon:yes stop_codon:yes gene_type:complete